MTKCAPGKFLALGLPEIRLRVGRSCEDTRQLSIAAYDADSATPAKSGVQEPLDAVWIPACAGMTQATAFQSSSRTRGSAARKLS